MGFGIINPKPRIPYNESKEKKDLSKDKEKLPSNAQSAAGRMRERFEIS